MELRKTGLVLLALLLATMALVPMVSANGTVSSNSYGSDIGSSIKYYGVGSHSATPAPSYMNVKVIIDDSVYGTSPEQTHTVPCYNTNTCTTPNYYYSPSTPGYYYVITTVDADGHGTVSNTQSVYFS